MRMSKFDYRQPELALGLEFVCRSAVESLCRWKPVRFLVDGSAKGGELASVTYEAWLRWYSPLCSRGAAVEGGAK